jgi:hypothetical protein
MVNQEFDNTDLAFSEGFKTGYLMAETHPELLDTILKQREADQDKHTLGMKEGKKSYEHWKNMQQLHGITKLRNKWKEMHKSERDYE